MPSRGGIGLPPRLGIEPLKPCECFRHNHDCDKRLDLPAALKAAEAFAALALAPRQTAEEKIAC